MATPCVFCARRIDIHLEQLKVGVSRSRFLPHIPVGVNSCRYVRNCSHDSHLVMAEIAIGVVSLTFDVFSGLVKGKTRWSGPAFSD